MPDESDDITQPHVSLTKGAAIGHYRIIERIGAGGMGKVYLAEDIKLEREVALKTLAKELASRSEFRERFFREARTAATLSHPNTGSIYSIEESDGRIFIVMEYVRGQTLRDLIRAGSVPYEQVVDVIGQCCEGLQAAHDAGIVHRDIKSSNIMLDCTGRVKIIDFGLARQVLGPDATQSVAMMGTYQYMSPEQISNHPLDHRSDLFSLGVVFYELTTGQLPFRGENPAAVALAITRQHPRPVATIRLDAPEYLQAILDRALAKDPADRYQSASALAVDLRAARPVSKEQSLRVSALASARISLVVFPFRQLTSDDESSYLAEGIYDEIITRLSKIRVLRVVSRSAAMRLARGDYELQDVATRLDVTYYCEGSLRRHGDDIHLNLRLVETRDGCVRWSSAFDKPVDRLLNLQAEIAEQAATALGIELGGHELESVVRRPTLNAEAYDLFLRAKFHAKKRDKESLQRAVELYRRAVELDPSFAHAFAGLAQSYTLILNYGYSNDPHQVTLVHEAANHALLLNSGCTEAHVSLGMLLNQCDHKQAEKEFVLACQIDPNLAEAYHYQARSLTLQGLYLRAFEKEQHSIALDPYQPIARAYLCRVLFFLDRYQEALDQLDIIRQDNLSPAQFHATRGWLLWYRGEWEASLSEYESAIQFDPTNVFYMSRVGDCLRRLGRLQEACQRLEQTEAKSYDNLIATKLGQVYRELDDAQNAVHWFECARQAVGIESRRWLEPRSVAYHYNMAFVFAAEGLISELVPHLEAAIEFNYGDYFELKNSPDWELARTNSTFRALTATLEAGKKGLDRAS